MTHQWLIIDAILILWYTAPEHYQRGWCLECAVRRASILGSSETPDHTLPSTRGSNALQGFLWKWVLPAVMSVMVLDHTVTVHQM